MRKIDLALRPGDDIAGRTVWVIVDYWPFDQDVAKAIGVEPGVRGLGPIIAIRFERPLVVLDGCYEHGYPEPYGTSYVAKMRHCVELFEGQQEISLVHGTGCKII